MKNVSDVLAEYNRELQASENAIVMGDSESSLLKNLDKIIEKNNKWVNTILILLVVSFILVVIFIWYWRQDTTVLIGIFTATGITLPWVINTMIKFWKDVSKAETLHVLVAHLNNDETTREVIRTLTKNTYQKND
jgi:hypothetical protein